MESRPTWTLTAICFGGASLLTIAALAPDFLPLNKSWAFIAAAATLIFVWVFAKQEIVDREVHLRDEIEREQELKETLVRERQTIDALAEGLNVGIFVCDSKGLIQFANERAASLFRFENPVGRTLLAVTISYELEQLLLAAISEDKPQSAEFTFSYPEERVAIADAWPEPGGQRAFLSLYDVTSLRRLERIRRDFVANVSHELRTPLATIRAMAETLLDDVDPKDELQSRYLKKITDDVDRLSLITQDLLVLSAAESNPVRPQELDLADLLRSTVHQLSSKATQKGLEITFEGPDKLIVQANPIQLSQVVINLIDNAINYTQEGSVRVELTDSKNGAEFKVIDTGIGIPSDEVGRIFERFYRVDRGRSRATGGTGLGLSIVKHIVEAHGGTVDVQSDLGAGSTFTVLLPSGSASAASR